MNYAHFMVQSSGVTVNREQIQFDAVPQRSEADVLRYLKGKTIKFLACARSCSDKIENSINLMSEIGAQFCDYKIFVLENDSNDTTYEVLRELKISKNIEVVKLDQLDSIYPNRTERLAFCRNTLLDQSNYYQSDYTCVMDVDGVAENNGDINGFISSFFFYECWDGVFPVNRGNYYDLWAFRHPELMPEDFFKRVNSIDYSCENLEPLQIIGRHIYNSDFSKLKGWLEIDSAFGGVAIYKSSSIKGARYIGKKKNDDVCEHVAFHAQMKKYSNAKLFINPKMIVSGQSIPSLEIN